MFFCVFVFLWKSVIVNIWGLVFKILIKILIAESGLRLQETRAEVP